MRKNKVKDKMDWEAKMQMTPEILHTQCKLKDDVKTPIQCSMEWTSWFPNCLVQQIPIGNGTKYYVLV